MFQVSCGWVLAGIADLLQRSIIQFLLHRNKNLESSFLCSSFIHKMNYTPA